MPNANGVSYKKIAEIVGAVIIVLAAGFAVLTIMKQQRAGLQPLNKLAPVKSGELPKGLPSDLPLETNAKLLNNFNATSPSGQYQGTRTYLSAKAMATNYDIYKNYLTAHKWTIVTEAKDPQHPEIMSVFARNAQGTISVSVQKNNVNPTGSTVNITFVSAK